MAIVRRVGGYPRPDAAAALPLPCARSHKKCQEYDGPQLMDIGLELWAELVCVTILSHPCARARPLVPHYYEGGFRMRGSVTCVIVIRAIHP